MKPKEIVDFESQATIFAVINYFPDNIMGNKFNILNIKNRFKIIFSSKINNKDNYLFRFKNGKLVQKSVNDNLKGVEEYEYISIRNFIKRFDEGELFCLFLTLMPTLSTSREWEFIKTKTFKINPFLLYKKILKYCRTIEVKGTIPYNIAHIKNCYRNNKWQDLPEPYKKYSKHGKIIQILGKNAKCCIEFMPSSMDYIRISSMWRDIVAYSLYLKNRLKFPLPEVVGKNYVRIRSGNLMHHDVCLINNFITNHLEEQLNVD